jgi:translocation and assembly module TamB
LELRWEGESLSMHSLQAEWKANDSILGLEAAFHLLDLAPVTLASTIRELTLSRDGEVRYQLAEPCEIRWEDGKSGGEAPESNAAAWHLSMGPLHWDGLSQDLIVESQLDWPHRGYVSGRAAGLVVSDFLDFVPWRDWQMEVWQAELVASWDSGPVSIEWSWNGTAMGPEAVPLSLRGRLRGDGAGLRIEEMTAATEVAPMLTVEGRVPVFLQPGAPNGWVQWDPDRSFDLRAATDATGLIVLPAGEAGTLHLRDPSVEFHILGSVGQPEGRIRAELNRAEWRSVVGALVTPPLDRVDLDAVLLRDRVRVERLEMEVDGQPVEVSAELPLDEAAWFALVREGRLPPWQEASADVRIANARLAPFSRYLPEMLSSQGQLDLTLGLRPGVQLEGSLLITNAATRAIGPLTPIRDLELSVQFAQRRATIDRFGGQIGGQPVGVTGRVELSEQGIPSFDLRVTGQNIPLVQRPGFLLRSDLDVRLESGTEQPPRVSGTLGLRDGLFMQDIASLFAGRLERPPVRPPYFSVTNAPFADWRLDLRIEGDRFLRVRIPVFVGVISATGRLRGTLRDPMVSGDARIQSGRVLFPFGVLPVDQGYATLGEGDPRGPVLSIVASGRNFRYHVRLEIEGVADDPLILFSSTPPLNSEEILLMLTAGELPQREIIYSKQARAGRLATYLGRELVTRFIGDETADQRLIINSGENIAEDGRTTYSIEYRLDPRWSVVGEYDRFNALNAGLKWRIFTR